MGVTTWSMEHKDVILKEKIGAGAYGTVWRARMASNNKKVAVKRIEHGGGSDMLGEMMKEAKVMTLFDHPNIVKFYGYVVDRRPYLLVMEFCNGGSIEDRLRDYPKRLNVSIHQRIDMCCQAAIGIEYLHSKQCIHRDIASRNCLLSGKVLKVADFGMCRQTSAYKVNLAKPTNVRWLAPEVWRKAETNVKTDVFAFTIMLWEFFIIPYEAPYADWAAGQVKHHVMDGYRMSVPRDMPKKVGKVMEACWSHDEKKRPEMEEIRKKLFLERSKSIPSEPSEDSNGNTKK